MGTLLEDLRFTVRSLRKSPGFTSLVVLTLGLGIGFNTAIYSIISTYLFRPLPVREPDRLVVLATRDKHADVPHGLSFPDYRDYRRLTAAFADALARREWPTALNWKNGSQTERLWADAVTPNYFSMLGVGTSAGRTFLPKDGRTPVAVLDYECWRQKFGADRGIVGRSASLGGRAFTIIGVAPEGFQGTQVSLRPDVYVPLETLGAQDLEQRDRHQLRVIARLQPGVSVAQARVAVNLLAAQLEKQYPDTDKGVRVITIAERFARPEPQVSEATPAIAVFSMAVVGLVLVLACANIANLLLARGIRRGREMALRAALGAGRMRIVRLLLAESLVLGLCGGAAGLLLAEFGIRLLRSRPTTIDLPVHTDWSPDGGVLVFATAVAVLTGILCGLMPAIEVSRLDLTAALKEGAGRLTVGKRRLSSMLVAAQVTVSSLLLIVAGLFIRGAQKAEAADLGFDRQNLQLLSVDLDKQNYSPTRGREFIRRVLDEIRSMPGVRAAAVAKSIPFDQQGSAAVLGDDQAANQRSEAIASLSDIVGPDYFRAMGIRLLEGREFGEHDDESGPRVAVINEALARRLWSGQNALGRNLRLASGDVLQVVGVVQTGKYVFLTEDPRPYLYLSFAQNYSAPTIFHVRTASNPAGLVPALRQAVRALDPELPVYSVKTMQDHLQHGYLFSAIVMGGALSGLFGLLGLALACMGLYGVVANSVGQRTREIGIRTALGATRGGILRLVIRRAMFLVGAGAALGFIGGIEAGQLLKRVLFSVDATDWATFALMITLLVAVALVACLVPARKATRVDPMIALRYE